ncbi:MAG: single-stranded DNA-binding protein [Erysipelotrichaceae bacterium]|nr:single-stranded DNA-binding protein [Erysipelotrichaceae bacterium]
MNVVVLAGKIVSPPVIEKGSPYQSSVAHMDVSVQRNFQNTDGDYDSDIFEVWLWKGVGEEIIAHFETTDRVMIRGRLEKKDDRMVVIAETVSLISEKKPEA